jgi:hypothetical protein
MGVVRRLAVFEKRRRRNGLGSPVLLTGAEQFETWLKGSSSEAFALARQHPVEAMRIVQAGLEKEGRLAAEGDGCEWFDVLG